MWKILYPLFLSISTLLTPVQKMVLLFQLFWCCSSLNEFYFFIALFIWLHGKSTITNKTKKKQNRHSRNDILILACIHTYMIYAEILMQWKRTFVNATQRHYNFLTATFFNNTKITKTNTLKLHLHLHSHALIYLRCELFASW